MCEDGSVIDNDSLKSEYCKDVEQSIRKKFRKTIWCKFTKAINEYDLVKEGLYSRVYFRRQGFHAYGKAVSGT